MSYLAGPLQPWASNFSWPLYFCHWPLSAMVWPQNQTRSVVDLISPEERTTLISPACQLQQDNDDTQAQQPSLLVLVESSLPNSKQRDVIRRSWARPSMVPASRAKVCIGRSKRHVLVCLYTACVCKAISKFPLCCWKNMVTSQRLSSWLDRASTESSKIQSR